VLQAFESEANDDDEGEEGTWAPTALGGVSNAAAAAAGAGASSGSS